MDDSAIIDCSCCGELIEIELDISAGRKQRYVEDCQVCCRPLVVSVEFADDGSAKVEIAPE